MKRLAYFALLVFAIVSTFLGLFPSPLTLLSPFAVAIALAAAVGVVAPHQVESRRWLRRLTRIGGAIIGIELISLAGFLLVHRRHPILLVVHDPVPTRVRVAYGVTDGQPRSLFAQTRRFDVPASAIVFSRAGADQGWFNARDPHPVQAISVTPSGGSRRVAAAWVAGGNTQSGGCPIAYDEFLLGDAVATHTIATNNGNSGGWLDSLDTWGLECRGTNLYRRTGTQSLPLTRTGPSCYYDVSGVMSCSITATKR